MNLDAIRNGVSLPNVIAKLPKVPVASAVAGLIVAALILMTPNPWFEAFVVETGLPGILTAAEPPLGARARIVFALIAALVVTLGAWAVLTAILGRKSQKRADGRFDYAQSEADEESPRIRRADSHPDAPYRRPIMAGDEMGIPLELVTAAPGETDETADAPDILELEGFAEDETDFVESAKAEEEPLEEEAAAIPPVAEAVDDTPDIPEPIFEIPLPQREATAEDGAPETHEQEDASAPSDAVNAPSEIKAELADLVARLEAGLKRKQARKHGAPKGFADAVHENVTPHPQAEPQSQSGSNHDAALREALNALQKVSGKAS
ncbi:hypothetical protein DFR46_1141 [Parasphingopyxis lamellibrachiae]|uniref:Uncharacterized protein n=2 Tax=Parasphingopyxis lamellibrachiae TaxID=680125 RepID=A0A3D9FEX1_9SPHN|nr:hypothetical protein DFR46_1141 [Parasphingopyxis lamellibrachiae]